MPEKTEHNPRAVQDFITRWEASGSAERANYTMFLTELCALLGVPGPEPTRPDDRRNAYVFERNVPMDDGDGNTTIGRIDLYKRGCFVLEAKQGSTVASADELLFAPERGRRGTAVRGTAGWDAAMKGAKGKAEWYVRSLPPEEGNPPFILVVDVGHVIELYSDFSRLGKTYSQFPDARTYRIALKDLANDNTRWLLARVWSDPLGLDPTRHSAKVTRDIADKLAKLAKSFESAGHHAEVVAAFLMRCLFTFFAEDVGLIDKERADEQPFTDLLKTLRGHCDQFVPMAQDVWGRMDAGGFSTAMRRKLKHFNGGLFQESHALPVTLAQLGLLIQAGESDWSDVEPAIFGTLLERALEPRERHKLGAHYTPRAYVERLVLPTVIEPLRERWDAARAAAFTLNMQGRNAEARSAVHDTGGTSAHRLSSTSRGDDHGPRMPSFKSDEEFLTYISMGAVGVRRVIDDLRQQGRTSLLLERGSSDFKLWKKLRIKGWRVPDILCVDTGRRIESRAKGSFEISGSHSTNNAERAWDFGLYDTDYVAIPVCQKSGDRPVDWKAIDLVQYASVGELRKARQAGLTVQPDAKGAQQGSEIRLVWPSSIATARGTVTDVSGERIKYRTAANRTNWVGLSKGGKTLTPLVSIGQIVQPFQVLASVVPVYQVISGEPRVDDAHYLKELESPSPSVRFSAAKALGLFKSESVIKALLGQLEKSDLHIFVRLEAAASLARFGIVEGWNFLAATLTSEFLSNRLESVIVLAEIDKPQARQVLLAILRDRQQDPEVRAGAAWALGEHHDKTALGALVQVFADNSPSVRIEAARALAKLTPDARADILEEFGATDDQRRPGVAWAMSKSGGQGIADLLPHLTTDDARQWAAYVIGTQDPQAYVNQIEQLKQHDPEVYFAVTVLWKILTSWVFNLKEYG